MAISSSKHILVVDDDTDMALFLSDSLRTAAEDWQVVVVTNVKDALAALVNGRFHLLVTDYQMPTINGLELIEHVRENWPQMRLFLVTSYGSDDIFEEMRRLQVDAYLNKPFDLDEFIETTKEILEKE